MYGRLATAEPGFTWSVATKYRDGASLTADIAGPIQRFAFQRGHTEYPGPLEAVTELAWLARALVAGLLNNIDLVHSAGWSWATPALLIEARRRRIPIVRELTTSGDAGGRSLGGRLIGWTNRLADHVIAISPALRARAIADIGTGTPIWCRPNAVDTTRFRPATVAERQERREKVRQWLPSLQPDDILVLHVGRIRPLKNQLFLADCVATLPKNFKMLLIGPCYADGDAYLQTLRTRLRRPDLRNRSYLVTENRPVVEHVMQAADIFAFPSKAEGLGTVMIEALCAGLPVVPSRIPGVTDWIVKDRENGYLAGLDVGEFSARIRDAAALRSMGKAIAAKASTQYNFISMDSGYISLFDKLLQKPPA